MFYDWICSRLHRTWVRFLIPFWYCVEDFRGATQYLYVKRWGRGRWELWRWPIETGSDDVDRALRGQRRRQQYSTIRQRARLVASSTRG